MKGYNVRVGTGRRRNRRILYCYYSCRIINHSFTTIINCRKIMRKKNYKETKINIDINIIIININ